MSFLEIEHVTKKFGDVLAVDDVSLEIEEGSFVTIVGPSGCGKTTTLRSIAGLETPTSGHIRVRGEDITELPPYKRDIGFVFQDYALFPHKTVFENIAFGLKMRGHDRDERAEVVDEMLAITNLEGYGEKLPSECSGGEQQRIAVARALAFDPDLVLMDEPLSNLDKNLRQTMRNELKAIQQETGVTTVYVTHNQNEALSMGDKIAVMNGGRLEQFDDPVSAYRRPESTFVADFLGKSTAITGTYRRSASDATVETDDGVAVVVDPDDHFTDGDAVTVFFRNEKLDIGDRLDGENVLDGTVDSIDYQGHDVNYFVRVSALGETIQVSHVPDSTGSFWQAGESVQLAISPSDVIVVDSPPAEPAGAVGEQ